MRPTGPIPPETDESKLARFDWYSSQWAWHYRRRNKSLWHTQQARWFRRQWRRIPGLFVLIVGRTIRKHSAKIANSITMNNTLFARLKERTNETNRTNSCRGYGDRGGSRP
jgi:hypothetical protein